jgi:hypothetical protein
MEMLRFGLVDDPGTCPTGMKHEVFQVLSAHSPSYCLSTYCRLATEKTRPAFFPFVN